MSNTTRAKKGMLALSVRQPWAELIMRGIQTVESRSRPTNVRGRIYIYASLGRYSRDDESAWASEYGVDVDALPRGVIVGTVELWGYRPGADGLFEWLLRGPVRLKPAKKATRRPNPVWFYPFG